MNILGEIIILTGSIFILLATIGTYKMPDYLMKLQVASKASAFGIFLMLIGGNILILESSFLISSSIIFLFLIITTPIGAHALANAAKKLKIKN
jgi:monovalent cation/proton antiporter MnhG/PhaG subunit